MKRNRFTLITTVLVPLLCICLQGWWTVKAVVEAEDAPPTQMVAPLSQLPLEDERHCAESVMQYAISVGTFSAKLSKWNGECLAVSAGSEDWCQWAKHPAKQSSHLLLQSDGRSVIIRLHHLII